MREDPWQKENRIWLQRLYVCMSDPLRRNTVYTWRNRQSQSEENYQETYWEAAGPEYGREVQVEAEKNIFQNTLRWHIPKSRAWYALILCHSIFDLPLPPSNLPVDNKAWSQMKENKHLSRMSCVLFYFRYFSPTSSVVFTHTHNKGN